MNLDRFGFKAKTINGNKQWGYGYFVPSKDNRRCLWYYDGGLRTLDIDAETISQCTGLEDSEGNLIYENDILEIETPHGKDNGVVYYQELDTSFRVWQEAFTMGLALVIEHIRTMGWKVKVIGNKFDNEER